MRTRTAALAVAALLALAACEADDTIVDPPPDPVATEPAAPDGGMDAGTMDDPAADPGTIEDPAAEEGLEADPADG